MAKLTPKQIKSALDAGIISAKQAADLGKPAAKSKSSVPSSAAIGNEEDMRFFRSFSDIFIALGVALAAIGVYGLAGLMGGGFVYLIGALVMFGLAEYFGHNKRQNAPTLVTAIAYLIFIQKGVAGLIGEASLGQGVMVSLITFLAMLGFYLRIRLPFCMALMAISLIYLGYEILAAIAPGFVSGGRGLFLILSGLVTFIVALTYDLKDPKRETRFSDNAFWLHFIAAPLMLHGIIVQFLSTKSVMLYNFIPFVDFDSTDAWIILMIVGIFTILAIGINRRVFMVSTIGYAALALGFLLQKNGLGIGYVFALVLLFLGLAIMVLGVGWHQIRGALLKVLPRWRIFPGA